MENVRKGRQKSAAIICASFLAFSGCHENMDHPDKAEFKQLTNIDPDLNLSREDYTHIYARKKGEEPPTVTVQKGAPPIPKISDILAAPRPPKIGDAQLVSIAVTDDVPLKDVLLELAKLADVDIELDAGISGGISFIARDKPFNEVVDRISDLAGLRYSMKNNVLRVERDLPYVKSYSLAFLNMDRDSDSSVNLSTNVLSSSVGGGSSSTGVNTGSTSSMKSKSASDFWKSLDAGIQEILLFNAPQRLSESTLQAEENGNMLAAATGAGTQPAANATPGSPQTTPPPVAPAPATPAAKATAPASSGSGAQGGVLSGKEYTINRQAGVLTVNATGKQHEMIERMLHLVRKNASSQVLIEAKIIEVTLNKQYQTGINWNYIGTKLNISSSFQPIPLPVSDSSLISTGTFSFAFDPTKNTNSLLNLIEGFGTVRTLSSPRLHAINNQQSTLTFAKNVVYFTITVTPATTVATTGGTIPVAATITSTPQTVPVGIIMTMMPSIDIDNNEVTLAVHPTLSTVLDNVNDPGATLSIATVLNSSNILNIPPKLQTQLSNLSNSIPEIQVRDLDSTLKLKSGETMVIGGLMQQESTNTDTGLPFIDSVPLVGNLFKGVSKETKNTELVLLIKATIVNANGSLNDTDAHIFHKFSDDPRPVAF